MNVIVANEKQNELSNLDIDIIKSITGVFETTELVEMFKNFFYNKMVLDVTAMKQYNELHSYEKLVEGLDADKIIFLLPEGSALCTPTFLSHLISLGVYNFTTNINGIKYLLKKPNTLQDVEHIQKMAEAKREKELATVAEVPTSADVEKVNNNRQVVLGFKNVTEHAGTTTFIYLLKKELVAVYGQDKVLGIEIDRNDFMWFNDKHMISIKEGELMTALSNHSDAEIVLVDLNNASEEINFVDTIYLLEPSTIRLNKLVRRKSDIFKKLAKEKVVLNQSMLLANDVSDFEAEAGLRVFYNMPPLDERKRNAIVNDFLKKLGLVSNASQNTQEGSNRIFGLFRR